jgi:hypothetical protein
MIRASERRQLMSRKPRAQRTPEEKWEIVQEGLRNGNIA